MANVIIGIHGLGNKPPKALLEGWWMLSMGEGLKRNNYDHLLPPFELAYWADIIHKIPLDPGVKDPDDPGYIDEGYVRAPDVFSAEDFSTRKMVVDYLRKQMNRIFLNEDLTLNYSFISDAIISRWFKDLEVYYSGFMTPKPENTFRINEVIRERLASKLRAHSKDNIMLVTHSMGSIIAFDVLTFLVPEIKINTFITMGSPLGIPAVISRIAAEHRERGYQDNLVRTPPGISGHWYNFSDILDKVAFNYSLSDSFDRNDHGVKPVDFLVTNSYTFNGVHNPHKSFGYLRTPEFSKVISEFILTEKITPGQKLTRRIKKSVNILTTLIRAQREHKE